MKKKYILVLSIAILALLFFALMTILYPSKTKGYYQNGNLKFEVEMQDDKRHGVYREYRENGELSAKMNYEYGKKHGWVELYDTNSQLKIRAMWKKGVQNGNIERYENGIITKRYLSIDKVINGPFFKYHKNGNISTKGQFINGEAIGEFFQYDSNGVHYLSNYYVIVRGKAHYNSYKKISDNGEIINDGSNYCIIETRDTLNWGDSMNVLITLAAPYFDSSYITVTLGDFDEEFNLDSTMQLDTVRSNTMIISIQPDYVVGINNIRGILSEIKPDFVDTAYYVRHMYFEKKVFVREK